MSLNLKSLYLSRRVRGRICFKDLHLQSETLTLFTETQYMLLVIVVLYIYLYSSIFLLVCKQQFVYFDLLSFVFLVFSCLSVSSCKLF